eukprot:5382786-Lingulodinium_polyedra.AAC.1
MVGAAPPPQPEGRLQEATRPPFVPECPAVAAYGRAITQSVLAVRPRRWRRQAPPRLPILEGAPGR